MAWWSLPAANYMTRVSSEGSDPGGVRVPREGRLGGGGGQVFVCKLGVQIGVVLCERAV